MKPQFNLPCTEPFEPLLQISNVLDVSICHQFCCKPFLFDHSLHSEYLFCSSNCFFLLQEDNPLSDSFWISLLVENNCKMWMQHCLLHMCSVIPCGKQVYIHARQSLIGQGYLLLISWYPLSQYTGPHSKHVQSCHNHKISAKP